MRFLPPEQFSQVLTLACNRAWPQIHATCGSDLYYSTLNLFSESLLTPCSQAAGMGFRDGPKDLRAPIR